MLKISSTHSMNEYMDLLSTSAKIYIDAERLESAIRESQYVAEDMQQLALLELRIESAGSYSLITPDNIIDFLYSIDVDLDKRFNNRKTKGASLDMKKVVEPLIESGIAVDMLTAYKKFRSYKSYTNFLRKLSTHKAASIALSDGRVMRVYETNLEERDNLRVYYSDIAVVSVPRVFSHIIAPPGEEYHLAWCDYPQADWRFAYNLFISSDKDMQTMRQCEDAYEGLARIVEGDSFDPEEFQKARKDYKVNCLSVFYNSQDNRPIPSRMRNYFHSSPRYQQYFYDLNMLYRFKLPIPCTSYFGFTQNLPEGRYASEFVSKGLNTPIQTFTSHVVNETVFGILEKFWELGYTKEDINIYFVRHDEPIFYFKDTILKDAWIFEDCSEIHIDGFSPIRLDFHFGDYYKEESQVLNEQIGMYRYSYPERIHRYEEGALRPYRPTPTVEAVYVQFFTITGDNDQPLGFHAVYYDYRTHERTVVDTAECGVLDALYDTIDTMLEKLNYPQYFLVQNDGLELIDSVGPDESILMKVSSKYDSAVAIARFSEVE